MASSTTPLLNASGINVLTSMPTGNVLYSPSGQSTVVINNSNIKLLKPLESTEYGKFDYLAYTKVQSGILNVPTNNETIFYTLESGNNRYVVFSYKNNLGLQFNAFVQLNSGTNNREDWGSI